MIFNGRDVYDLLEPRVSQEVYDDLDQERRRLVEEVGQRADRRYEIRDRLRELQEDRRRILGRGAKRYDPCVRNAHEKSGIPLARLQESYDRGIGAWRTNPSSVRNRKGVKGGPGRRMPKEQWACARVNKLARLRRRAGYDKDLLGKGMRCQVRSVTATRV